MYCLTVEPLRDLSLFLLLRKLSRIFFHLAAYFLPRIRKKNQIKYIIIRLLIESNRI